MAKHTLKEILAHFGKHAEHTHEAAAQATYDLGHAAGREEAKAEFAAGVGDTAPATPAAGAPIDEEVKDAQSGEVEKAQDAEGVKTGKKSAA